jgi:hypothetical protein
VAVAVVLVLLAHFDKAVTEFRQILLAQQPLGAVAVVVATILLQVVLVAVELVVVVLILEMDNLA